MSAPSPHRRSYAKTAIAAGGAGAVLAGGAIAAGLAGGALAWVGALLGIAAPICGLVAAGGWLAVRRDLAEAQGEDLFVRFNRGRYEPALASAHAVLRFPALRRLLTRQPYVVGDWVRVRPLAQIRATLDADGALEGMPFMAEMERYAGQVARVFRVVDRLYDYGGNKRLRWTRGSAVLLRRLRCDGSAHGGCQAACYLMWKPQWLEPASGPETVAQPGDAAADANAAARASDDARYVCQYTQVVASSTPMRSWDPRADLVPLLVGNVAPRAFVVALLTRWFNRVQLRRGGTRYPYRPEGHAGATRVETLGLAPGDRVRVRDKASIAATLNERGMNRGLWFDPDMIKHCGRSYEVEARVERIIDDRDGKMVTMKTPCIMLKGVYTSGEIHRFWAQHDCSFWREAWLLPETDPRARK
jgi:hypothetical protein